MHHSKKVRDAYDGFKLLFLPSYSSHLSGVERLWSVVKKELGTHLDRIPYELNQHQFRAEVDWLCDKINLTHDGRTYFMGAREDLLKALK